jgi:hypothetical protein
MKTEDAIHNIWGAQAASLQFAAACREHSVVFSQCPANIMQAGSLRSPTERSRVDCP